MDIPPPQIEIPWRIFNLNITNQRVRGERGFGRVEKLLKEAGMKISKLEISQNGLRFELEALKVCKPLAAEGPGTNDSF